MFKYYLYFCFYLFFNFVNADITRTLLTEVLNPPNGTVFINGSYKNLVHTKAVGLNDTLHYVYSTRGAPYVLIVLSQLNVKLNVNWTLYLSDIYDNPYDHGLTFDNGSCYYSSIISFKKLLEYNDINDQADLNKIPADKIAGIDLSKVSWEQVALTSDAKRLFISFTTCLFRNNQQNFTIRMEASSTTSISPTLPHMNLHSNLTQIDIIMSNITSEKKQPNLRFGLELVFKSMEVSTTMKAGMVVDKSIDDEQSPGAFKIFNLETNVNDLSHSFFMQWKPICYTTVTKTVLAVTSVKNYPISYNLTSNLPSFDFENHSQIFGMNISFGITGDKFYSNTNYAIWTFTYGWGIHPYSSISTSIILLIAIGFGIPIVIVLLSYLCLLIKKSSQRKGYIDITSSYPEI